LQKGKQKYLFTKDRKRTGDPLNGMRANYGASKGNQKALPLLSLFPARRHIFDIPHRSSLLLQNKF